MTPPQTIAHYRMIAKIGEGGMGEVYRALDTKLGREVAIKIIPEAFARTGKKVRLIGVGVRFAESEPEELQLPLFSEAAN